jgi:hypothetical protein
MSEKVNHEKEYSCKICNKLYSCQSSLCNHNKKFHSNNVKDNVNNVKDNVNNVKENVNKSLTCEFCNKIFNNRPAKSIHKKVCKQKDQVITISKNEFDNIKKQLEDDTNLKLENTINEMKKQFALILKEKGKTNKLEEENMNLKKELKNINLTKIKKDIDEIKNNPAINNQLINMISDKNKKIEELNKAQQVIQSPIQPIIEKQINTFESLTLNNIIITSRSEDNFINATQLCQAGYKKFNDWYRLDNTKNLINEATSDTGIPASLLVDVKKGNSTEFIQGTWIH